MHPMLRTVLAVVVGIIVGGIVNMALIALGPMVIPPPPGTDMTTAEGLEAAMPLLTPKHFVMPFLAHALGTLAGALAGAAMAVTHRSRVAYIVGFVFLAGGLAAVAMIPAPTWFIALDLIVAYLPMAWLGLSLANRLKPATAG